MIKINDFKKEINLKRKNGGWYSGYAFVEGNSVAYKGYKTWLQVYKVGDVNYSTCMGISVKAFNEALEEPFLQN